MAFNIRYRATFNEFIRSKLALEKIDINGRCASLVTIMFGRSKGRAFADERLSAFGVLYNDLCKRAIGKNHYRISFLSQKPVAVACIDAEGSKYASSLVDPRNVHIHSIWSYGQGQSESIETALCSVDARLLKKLDIQHVDLERLPGIDDVRRAIAYATKLVARNVQDLSYGNDFEVYPKTH